MKTNGNFLTSILLVFAGVFYTSCCPLNPKLNSVKTAHGNTDWHINTAEEFLTGKDMNGNNMASNYCPDTWTKSHMHVGSTNTNNNYYDIGKVTSGKDCDASSGIDQSMLFFYAGHGNPTTFNTLGNSATLPSMKLGNCDDKSHGLLRYFWQCSCEVFAHGPVNCTGSTEAYTCPEDFDGSADSYAMRNVYERWGPVLSPELRMACGSSTLAYCWETETNKIWDYYNNQGYDVADAFIWGLHRLSYNCPLCITTGGISKSSTPLFDQTFTNKPNPSGAYLHIQFLSGFASNVPQFHVHIPELLPVFELIPLPWPEKYKRETFQDKEGWRYSGTKLKVRGIPEVKINNASGSVYIFGERMFEDGAKQFGESKYLDMAGKFIREQGWTEKEVSEPVGQKMMLQSVPNTGKRTEQIQNEQKNVSITFNRVIMIGRDTVKTVGEGGKVVVQLNNDGSLYNASKVWRPIKGKIRVTKSKPYEQAFAEAIKQVGEQKAYKLESWTWGYDEYAGNVEQKELKAVYIFYFIPVDREKAIDYPPMAIKVSAHLE